MNKIGISTGIFYKFYEEEEINRSISHISRWNVEIVEILLSRLFMLDIPVSEENKEFLSSKEVIIHSPFFVNEGYNLCKLGREEIKKLVKLAKQLNAKYIIVHPDLIEDLSILDETDFPFALENIKPEFSEIFSLENLKNTFENHKNLKLALDPGHAKNLTIEQMKEISDDLGNLSELHAELDDVNAFLKNGEETHSYFRTFNVPIVFEKFNDLRKVHLVIKKTKEILHQE